MLTAADVEQKTFSTALRGYDLDEVDDFLDEMVATLRELNEQLDAARRASPVEPADVTPASAAAPEPIVAASPPLELDESAIGRAMLAAQNAADKLLEEAQSEAMKIVDEAKGEADTWQEEREAKRADALAEIASLAERVTAIRAELSVLAGEVSVKLDDMDAVIERSSPHASKGMGGDHLSVVADGADAHGDEDPLDSGNRSADHLDEILTGVATDLQLSSADESGEGEASDDESPDDEDSESEEDE